MNEALLETQIRAKIASIDAATVSNVHLAVSNQTVFLSGDVPSAQERQQILIAVRATDGVANVVDRLRVNPKAPTARELENDLALQARIKAALTEQAGVNAFKVKVDVHKGAVQLSGAVPTRTVHALVVETVRAVPGVRSLHDGVRVAP
ncbi:MAG: BON domain-containing protein [Candidatus Eremiobacteraeota bacterium]|nr:BON domain-containing protein [Candidatus Eremiobacteraeota bacterium]